MGSQGARPTRPSSIERMKAVSYDQVTQLDREFLGSQAGELTIVGDFDAKACLPISRRSAWQRNGGSGMGF